MTWLITFITLIFMIGVAIMLQKSIQGLIDFCNGYRSIDIYISVIEFIILSIIIVFVVHTHIVPELISWWKGGI